MAYYLEVNMPKREKIWGTAGTGKTTSLVNRIKSAQKPSINRSGVLAKNIIFCTFRRNSADDMINKLRGLNIVNQDSDAQWMSTIHGIGYRLMGANKHNVINPADIKQFSEKVKLGTGNINLDYTDDETVLTGRVGEFFKIYMWLSNTMTPIERCNKYPNLLLSGFNKSTYRRLHQKYADFKQELGKVDFCDMLDNVIASGNVPQGCKMLVVDEFQDLTPQQYRVFEMLADSVDTVIVAGDPLQTIYGYQGATPRYFDEYDAEQTILNTSYRLPERVWGLSQRIIARHGMDIPDVGTVKDAGLLEYINSKKAEKLYSEYPTKTMHLVRAKYQAVPISYMLADAGVVFLGMNGWNIHDVNLINAIIKMRSSTPITTTEAIEFINAIPQSILNAKKSIIKKSLISVDGLVHSIHDIKSHTGLTGYGIIEGIVNSTAPTAKMNIPQLRHAKVAGALKRHMLPIELNDDTVKLFTIHGSKGLEADTVFLHAGITAKIQQQKANKKYAAEEARVFFVGATRTKQNLYIVNDPQTNYKIPKVTA